MMHMISVWHKWTPFIQQADNNYPQGIKNRHEQYGRYNYEFVFGLETKLTKQTCVHLYNFQG